MPSSPRRPPRPGQQLAPRNVEKDYEKKILAGPVAVLTQLVRQELLPLFDEEIEGTRSDADSTLEGRVNNALRRVMRRWRATFPDEKLYALAEKYAHETDKHQRGQLGRQFVETLGVDPFALETWIPARIEAFTAENVALIQSIPKRLHDDVQSLVTEGMRSGSRPETLRKRLLERTEVSKSRAQFIARDQIGKFNASLNTERQTKIGVTHYYWRTSKDQRVRPDHQARDGQRFAWDSPPPDGHPGTAVQCRCYAEPDLSALIESL